MSTEPFVKLLSSITDSSVWMYDDQTRIVWITMLAMANRSGVVRAAIPGIANRARVPVEAAEKALNIFESPDPYSRNPDNEGRRIRRVEGGYLILNYSRIRELKQLEAERERKRNWWRENRSKNNLDDGLAKLDTTSSDSLQAEADREADTDTPNGVSKTATKTPRQKFSPPTVAEVAEYVKAKGYTFDPEAFVAHYEARGWQFKNGTPMKSWQAACTTWSKNQFGFGAKPPTTKSSFCGAGPVLTSSEIAEINRKARDEWEPPDA